MSYLNGRKPFRPLFVPAGLLLLFLASCIDDSFSDRVRFRPTVMMPLAHGNLTLGNLLLTGGSDFSRDPDNTIRLVLRADSLISVSLDEILDLPLPDTISRTFSTGQVRIKDFSTSSKISLYEIASRIDEPERSFIMGSSGKTALFPEVPSQDIGDLPSEKIEQLEFARFSSGVIELSARNNLPVPVSMEVILLNEACQKEIARFDFRDIQPGASVTLGSSIEGKLVRQSITSRITAFSTRGSTAEVVVDTGQSIEFDINARKLQATGGKVMLEKTLLDTGRDALVIHFANDVELQELIMKSIIFNYSLDNRSGGLNLEVVFNTISKDGEKRRFNIVPDGKGGNLAGYRRLSDVDLDVANDVRICMEYSLYAGSDENVMTEFDLSGENFDFELWFSYFRVGYASGYLGSGILRPVAGYLNFNLDFFRNISGDLLLSDPSLKLFYENSGGVPSELLLNMTAWSADSTQQVSLFDEERRVFPIIHADEPFTSVSDEIIIKKESSNIIELLRLTPPDVRVDASVLMNPLGRAAGINNFITSESTAYMGMEFELPLDMQFTDLILTDTVATGMGPGDYNMLEEVFLNLQITNSLPGGASISLALYDSLGGQVLHTFDEILLMEPASVDDRGVVIGGTAVSTETEIEILNEVFDRLKQSSHFIISARLDSGNFQDGQVPVRFMTGDKLDFKIKLIARLAFGN